VGERQICGVVFYDNGFVTSSAKEEIILAKMTIKHYNFLYAIEVESKSKAGRRFRYKESAARISVGGWVVSGRLGVPRGDHSAGAVCRGNESVSPRDGSGLKVSYDPWVYGGGFVFN
jgi:hypothetical protein